MCVCVEELVGLLICTVHLQVGGWVVSGGFGEGKRVVGFREGEEWKGGWGSGRVCWWTGAGK